MFCIIVHDVKMVLLLQHCCCVPNKLCAKQKEKVVGIQHTAASNTNRIFTDVSNCYTDLRYQTHFL